MITVKYIIRVNKIIRTVTKIGSKLVISVLCFVDQMNAPMLIYLGEERIYRCLFQMSGYPHPPSPNTHTSIAILDQVFNLFLTVTQRYCVSSQIGINNCLAQICIRETELHKIIHDSLIQNFKNLLCKIYMFNLWIFNLIN